MSIISFAISLLAALVWITSLYHDIYYQPRLGHSWYIYKLVMLTNLNFNIITMYSILVLFTYTGYGKRLTDHLYYTTIFPLAVVTCGLFWGLYAIEPSLVMPEWIAQLIPSWLNHVTHTYPLIYVLIDIILHSRRAPTKLMSLYCSISSVFVYFAIIFYVRYSEGYWLYPLLEMFIHYHFLGAYIVGVIGFYILTRLPILIQTVVHDRKSSSTDELKNK